MSQADALADSQPLPPSQEELAEAGDQLQLLSRAKSDPGQGRSGR